MVVVKKGRRTGDPSTIICVLRTSRLSYIKLILCNNICSNRLKYCLETPRANGFSEWRVWTFSCSLLSRLFLPIHDVLRHQTPIIYHFNKYPQESELISRIIAKLRQYSLCSVNQDSLVGASPCEGSRLVLTLQNEGLLVYDHSNQVRRG
jgi:hypothetical protein